MATEIIYAVGKLSQVASHVIESVSVFLPSGHLNFYPGVGGSFPSIAEEYLSEKRAPGKIHFTVAAAVRRYR